LTALVDVPKVSVVTGDFGVGDSSTPVAHPDAVLRAADANRPMDYRNATDRAGAGVSLRVVALIVAVVVLLAWILTTYRA
jgi:hypothetical protein